MPRSLFSVVYDVHKFYIFFEQVIGLQVVSLMLMAIFEHEVFNLQRGLRLLIVKKITVEI